MHFIEKYFCNKKRLKTIYSFVAEELVFRYYQEV